MGSYSGSSQVNGGAPKIELPGRGLSLLIYTSFPGNIMICLAVATLCPGFFMHSALFLPTLNSLDNVW